MVQVENPALQHFLTRLGAELVLAQVLIRRAGIAFDLCHVGDREAAPETLRAITPAEVRSLAQYTVMGEFRPLKSAPSLQKGWRLRVSGGTELELALARFYPGAIADWYAAQSDHPPVTHYREFAGRQSGMYRITAMLADVQAAQVIRSGCAAANCLKQRLWTVPGLGVNAAGEKSLIPCLEPCAVLLELSRKAVRLEQEQRLEPALQMTAQT